MYEYINLQKKINFLHKISHCINTKYYIIQNKKELYIVSFDKYGDKFRFGIFKFMDILDFNDILHKESFSFCGATDSSKYYIELKFDKSDEIEVYITLNDKSVTTNCSLTYKELCKYINKKYLEDINNLLNKQILKHDYR